ncbi:MAG: hypothetical protein BMS9Abin20_1064 [Acidimicrobiia bacterium]|nr:MAG: hypothetical protein BMS9Abin20_1064 [Acidimicrobiia bacterium]
MHDLIGTWRLVDWTVTMGNGRVIRPFGGKASGLITYTDEGRMVASLMKSGREAMGTRSFNEATALERASAAAGYLTYAGRYEILGDQVHHHVELSLFPDWVGGTLVRHIEWIMNGDGTTDLDLLDLGTEPDRSAVMRLRWHRIVEERT